MFKKLKEFYNYYKNTKVTKWYDKLIAAILFSKLYKLIFSLILIVIFAIPAQSDNINVANVFEKLMWVAAIYPLCITLWMFAYAFVINPIKTFKERRKELNDAKERQANKNA